MLLSASEPIWSLSPEEVLRALQTTSSGLPWEEAAQRLERFGPNRLPAQRRRPLLLRFLDQLVHFMALLLWVAGALAFLAGTPPLGWAIWAVVVVNGVFSFWQEFQAERTLAALGRSLPREVRVWRGGELCVIAAEALVPGDLLQLEAGDRVPADARLLEAHDLYLDTAVLTGESLPVARHAQAQRARPGPGAPEQGNLVLAGCTVASGRGSAIVYATGSETEFGHVAHLTAATDRGSSTLELQIRHVVRTITTVALVVGAATFLLDLLFVGMGPLESLLFAVGILVAFVPEGLLPQVTLTLALNVRRMAARQALVRRLSAVESLGSVSVICSDKTGTLTCNAMVLQDTWLPDSDPALRRRLLRAATLCSNARLERSEHPGEPWRALGDSTETALLLAAVEAGLLPEEQQRRFPRRQEVPFDSHRRRMSVLVDATAAAPTDDPEDWGAGPGWTGRLVLTKGAPPEVLERCSTLAGPAGPRPLREVERARVHSAHDGFADRGFRVIAVALRTQEEPGPPEGQAAGGDVLESDLCFLGLLGLYDPPRPEVSDAIRRCREAGIKVTMVTGDYGRTAQAIARQIGLLDPQDPAGPEGADPVRVIEGPTLAQIREPHLRQLLKYRTRLVFARMAPEQKLRLVQAYRALGEVVAVTGDGVNDAPALRAADVGLAMGRNGTDVAREAADIVLLDDNFATIVEAVRLGRAVVSNIRRFTTYILVANLAEALPFLAMVVLRIPAALSVMQILAVDLGTDILPALALGAEPPEAGVLRRPPRPRGAPLLDRSLMVRAYLVLGLTEALAALGAYLLVWRDGGVGGEELRQLAPLLLHGQAPVALAQRQLQAASVTFTAIVLGQVGALLACRRELGPRLPWAGLPGAWRENPLLLVAIATELLLTALMILLPPLAGIFTMAPYPLTWLPPLLLTPLLVLGADALRLRATAGRPGR